MRVYQLYINGVYERDFYNFSDVANYILSIDIIKQYFNDIDNNVDARFPIIAVEEYFFDTYICCRYSSDYLGFDYLKKFL